LFDPATVERMVDHFHNLLEEITKAPEQHVLELPLTSGSKLMHYQALAALQEP